VYVLAYLSASKSEEGKSEKKNVLNMRPLRKFALKYSAFVTFIRTHNFQFTPFFVSKADKSEL